MIKASSGATAAPDISQLFQPSTRRIVQKAAKAEGPHAHHRRGHWSSSVRPAPPTHPASCLCARPSMSAAARAARLPKFGLSRPISTTRAHTHKSARACDSAADSSFRHARRHLQVVGHDRARAGRRRGAWRVSDFRLKLRPILLPNEAPRSSQQGIEWQGSARVHGERHGRVAARRAEAAHLSPAVNSTISMMLSAESGAAGSDNVGALPRT